MSGERMGAAAGGLAVHYSSATAEYYTPAHVIAIVLACLEAIDVDPCSNSHADPNVPAAQHFTIAEDGLRQPWHGRVYLPAAYASEPASATTGV